MRTLMSKSIDELTKAEAQELMEELRRLENERAAVKKPRKRLNLRRLGFVAIFVAVAMPAVGGRNSVPELSSLLALNTAPPTTSMPHWLGLSASLLVEEHEVFKALLAADREPVLSDALDEACHNIIRLDDGACAVPFVRGLCDACRGRESDLETIREAAIAYTNTRDWLVDRMEAEAAAEAGSAERGPQCTGKLPTLPLQVGLLLRWLPLASGGFRYASGGSWWLPIASDYRPSLS